MGVVLDAGLGVKSMEQIDAEKCFAEVMEVLQKYQCAIVPMFIISGSQIINRWEVVSIRLSDNGRIVPPPR